MDAKSIGILAAQLAASAAAIAAAIFIPPPFGQIIAAAIEATTSLILDAINGSFDNAIGATTAVAMAAISAIPGTGAGAAASKAIGKVAPNATKTINRITINVEKFTKKINNAIDKVAPDKLIEKAASKWAGNNKTTKLEDAQLIMKKQNELETNGQVRTEKKINSTTFNKDQTSWIKCAHFEETRFIDRNNILGNLTIMYYQNNDSRLMRRKDLSLNGNFNLVAIKIPNCRYKNDYVSGICRAKSWGSYYMRTWMIGKPGRGIEGLNTAFWFGSSWRVDKKLISLANQYQNLDKVLLNYSQDTAMKFLGKTKIGTKLLSYHDVYTKTKTTTNQLKSGNATVLKSVFKKYKNKKG